MISVALSVVVPLLIYFGLPSLLKKFGGHEPGSRKLLMAAGLLYFVSIYLPSPLIDGSETKFFTHFIGGGVFSGLLWLYLKNNLRWKMNPWLELASLYFLVSGLGVANELFEFFLAETNIMYIPTFDTWWDLLANILGALSFWLAYKITRFGRLF